MIDEQLVAAVAASTTAEFTTVRNGRPATHPVTPTVDRDHERLVVSCSPAFAGKAARATETPEVGLLLHGPDGPLAVRGTATVRDDDLEANAHRLRRMFEAEPPSAKRTAMLDAASFMESRLGLLLLDWYGLRILIEIDPVAVDNLDLTTDEETAGSGLVSEWPAADIDVEEADRYDRVVATVVDSNGWPRSWPLASLDPDGRSAPIPVPSSLAVTDGQPACLCCHWYTADLKDLGQHLVRGRIQTTDDGPRFAPASSSTWWNESGLDRLRFIIDGKRQTRQYFAERGERYQYVPRAIFQR